MVYRYTVQYALGRKEAACVCVFVVEINWNLLLKSFNPSYYLVENTQVIVIASNNIVALHSREEKFL